MSGKYISVRNHVLGTHTITQMNIGTRTEWRGKGALYFIVSVLYLYIYVVCVLFGSPSPPFIVGERLMLFIVSQAIFWKHPSHKLATIKVMFSHCF